MPQIAPSTKKMNYRTEMRNAPIYLMFLDKLPARYVSVVRTGGVENRFVDTDKLAEDMALARESIYRWMRPGNDAMLSPRNAKKLLDLVALHEGDMTREDLLPFVRISTI